MEFIVSSSDLSSHLQAISRVINSKNTFPILDCFLFELQDGVLSATASDNENTIVTTIPVTGGAGLRLGVPAKTLLDALKEVPEQPLTFEINPDSLEITVHYQNGQYNLMGQNADEFPGILFLEDESVVKVEMDAQTLYDGINRTLFATADDELRPVMNGIYFDMTGEDITWVASDGHKLVRNKCLSAHGKERASFILPKKPANLLRNLLPKEEGGVTVSFGDRNALFTLSEYRMSCRLIDGRYPNYNSVIPVNNPYKVTADRQQLLGAMRRVAVFASEASGLIKMHLKENELCLSTEDIDFSTSAKETLTCQYTGSAMSIGFKANFLIDILSNIPTDEVIIDLADPSRAVVVHPSEQGEQEDLLMLLMPMMLND